jgi:molybdate transport system permease protein
MADPQREQHTLADWPFFLAFSVLGGAYVLLIAAMLTADASYTSPFRIWQALGSPAIRYAIWLSLLSCSITAILSVWTAVPLGYLLSRFDFPGRRLIDVLIDIPIVLPPLVVGLSLLILFQTPPGRFVESVISVTYAIPSVILAQFSVACAFAVRTMRGTFDQIPRRREQVAMTLGCSRGQAFWRVTLPEARRGVVAAFTLAWARSLGEFGPILVFSGATRFRTEVLSTTVFLELSVGNLEAAIAVSLLMVAAAVVVLVIVQMIGAEKVLA